MDALPRKTSLWVGAARINNSISVSEGAAH